ncbi:hypothetical protein BH24GEM3_BH24GEM3_02100 [soil metagenome]
MAILVRDVTIVVVAPNHSAGALSQSFLRDSGIVPGEWSVVGSPITTELLSQVVYGNGVQIVATPDHRLTFSEVVNRTVGKNESLPVRISGVAERYLRLSPYLRCTAVGINLACSAAIRLLASESGSPILGRFIVDGPWKLFEGGEPAAAVRFGFARPDRGLLTVSIEDTLDERGVVQPDQVSISTNFHHGIEEDLSSTESLNRAIEIVSRASEDIATTRALITETLLPQDQESVR